jgi:hypothetical protein
MYRNRYSFSCSYRIHRDGPLLHGTILRNYETPKMALPLIAENEIRVKITNCHCGLTKTFRSDYFSPLRILGYICQVEYDHYHEHRDDDMYDIDGFRKNIIIDGFDLIQENDGICIVGHQCFKFSEKNNLLP